VTEFVNRRAMIEAAEREVREEARRHPDDPWTPDRDRRWAEKINARPVEVSSPEFSAAVVDARKRLRNELLLERFEQVRKAADYRDRCEARGERVPNRINYVLAWANEPRKWLDLYGFDEGDDAESVEAIAAIRAVLR
jgi:hypothetical protein